MRFALNYEILQSNVNFFMDMTHFYSRNLHKKFCNIQLQSITTQWDHKEEKLQNTMEWKLLNLNCKSLRMSQSLVNFLVKLRKQCSYSFALIAIAIARICRLSFKEVLIGDSWRSWKSLVWKLRTNTQVGFHFYKSENMSMTKLHQFPWKLPLFFRDFLPQK